jgi:tetratricopeptide (TPR) repeat protein
MRRRSTLTPTLSLAALVLAMAASAVAAPGQVAVTPKSIVLKAPECAPLFKGAGGADASTSNLWESAKMPSLRAHCDLLQLGVRAFREGRFTDALAFATRADAEPKDQPGPWVIRGEAYARWGNAEESVKAFEKAKAIHPRALDDAEALDDYGAVLVRLKRAEDARKVYRALLPRASGALGLCPFGGDCDAAALAYVTAGQLAIESPASLEEAIAILREARAHGGASTDVRRTAVMALALALDRRGDSEQARDLVAKIFATEVPPEIKVRFIAPEEATAMRAFALEANDPGLALEQWKAYLAQGGDKRAWAAHAKAHVAKLEKAPKKLP